MKIELTYHKSTKNKHVYMEKGDKPAVESMYINKSALEGKPEKLTVTIEAK